MLLQQIYDRGLAQYAYLIACQGTGEAILIDPERDVDRYLSIIKEYNLKLIAVAETHIHADFLSGARELTERLGIKAYLSAEGKSSGWNSKWAENGSYDVTFVKDGDAIQIGNVTLEVMSTPGHTPEHISFLIVDNHAKRARGMLSGDFIFVGDVGRPDLLETAAKQSNTMKESAKTLYRSVQKIIDDKENEAMLIWPAHGAGSSCGKGLGAVPQSSIGYEKNESLALKIGKKGEEPFVNYILKDQPDPPLYFARMKELNRDGVPLLGKLPQPKKLSVEELKKAIEQKELLTIDTRENRADFMENHLPGALFAPFSANFCTTVGSLVTDPSTPILLIGSPEHEEELIRRLIRIGYDNIKAFTSLEVMNRYFDEGGISAKIEMIDFMIAEEEQKKGGVIVDVRYKGEYTSGHLEGAIHAPYSRLPEYLSQLPKDKHLIVHCGSGHRAGVSSAYLSREGYKVHFVNDNLSKYRKSRKVI